jgi:hypothetical protein
MKRCFKEGNWNEVPQHVPGAMGSQLTAWPSAVVVSYSETTGINQ